ncbi:hypothetical protein AB0451_03105 [Streptomyces sp. NPDC052000]|uniref:hypothetical protein n=1 Tax=Streptomyces sp. NPDC052000 TaxID=3155676 RepID=UPI0034500B46
MQVGRKWPGSAPGHEWKKAGDVVEVDDDLGQELVAIPDGGFYEVVPTAAEDHVDSPEPEHGEAADENPAPDEAEGDQEVAPEEPKRRPGRPRKPKPEAEISE